MSDPTSAPPPSGSSGPAGPSGQPARPGATDSPSRPGPGLPPDADVLRSVGLAILWPGTTRLAAIAANDQKGLCAPSVAALGKIGDSRVLDGLATLIDSEQTAEDAIAALALFDDPRIVPRLLAVLDASVPKVISATASALGHFASPAVVAKLAPLLRSPHGQVRKAAIESLGRMGMPEATKLLVEVLSDSNEEIVIAALKALRQIKSENTDALVGELTARYVGIESPKVRATLVHALTTAESDKLLDLARKALRDSNPRVRANAIEMVASMPIPEKRKLALLKPMVQDGENNRVLANLAAALGAIDVNTSIQVLSRLLNSSEKWERASGVYAARFVQNERVTSWLTTQFTTESDPDVLRNIIDSLAHFKGPAVAQCFIKALAHENPLVRTGAARCLGPMGDPAAVEHLSKLLEKEVNPDVLAEALCALGRIADPARIPLIARFLQNTDLRVQANAIEALHAIGTVEIIPYIEPFLNSSDNRVKANAAVALWTCGSLTVVKELVQMLDSPNLRQRSSAIYAMGEIGQALRQLQDVPRYLLLISALREEGARLRTEGAGVAGEGVGAGGPPPRDAQAGAGGFAPTLGPDTGTPGAAVAGLASPSVAAGLGAALGSTGASGAAAVQGGTAVVGAPGGGAGVAAGVAGGSSASIDRLPSGLFSRDLAGPPPWAQARGGPSPGDAGPRPSGPEVTPDTLRRIEDVLSLLGSGNLEQAVTLLAHGLSAEPSNPWLLYMAAELDRRRGEAGSACARYEALQRIDAGFINAHINLASLYSRSHEIPQSLTEYFAALRTQVAILHEQIDLGLTLLKDKRIDEATLLLKALMGQLPLDARLHLKAGRELLRYRLPGKALAHLVKAYLAAPTSAEEVMRLAVGCLEAGLLAEAHLMATKLEQITQGDAEANAKARKLLEMIAKRGPAAP